MSRDDLVELLKDPAVQDAIRDLLVELAAKNSFAAYPGLNLPGVARPGAHRF